MDLPFAGLVECRVVLLAVEPPELALLHAYLLVAGAQDTCRTNCGAPDGTGVGSDRGAGVDVDTDFRARLEPDDRGATVGT